MSDIKVSICCLAFNHERYIRQCLDGFVMQKCDFTFEVLIHDDASKDKTASIIKEYETKYPGIIKPIYQSENQFSKGVKPTFAFNFPRVKGKYIAMCEGDDYWTDSLKLQKQVDFLENNLDYNLVAHYTKDSLGRIRGVMENDIFTFEDIYYIRMLMPTSSLVFRNNLVFPAWASKLYGGDRAVIFINAQKGKLKILPFEGSFYRIHEGGIEQQYKKDKFKLPIRNINDDIVYYNIIKHLPKCSILAKKIVKNHMYLVVQSIIRFNIHYLLMSLYSLFLFKIFKRVSVRF